ncbi:replication protein A 32 kDa subunit-A-like isoform X2 [Betta splendens]|uniref:Replication protein A 32 kDa subunit-A-like isoform X2 n=1 Tax=Betta splendens TaxID=158456 RepID=A0A8M1HJZ4_BETSP|nr:replication protein A 32 kDa subunit-A-like isoform X2 [Betta splendens]
MCEFVMWNQACSQSGGVSCKTSISKAALQILPCTVSQLLSASQVNNDTFAICDWEFNQVSIVGVIRGFAPVKTSIHYTVDDMTAPPLIVKQWVNDEAHERECASPGTYVKVIGSLRKSSGQRSLLGVHIRCLKDLNEITSHMLEVVQAHMELFRRVFDVNMNTTLAPLSGSRAGGHPQNMQDL